MADVCSAIGKHDPSLVDGLEHLQWAKDFMNRFERTNDFKRRTNRSPAGMHGL